jgi:hypothetical protein
MVVLVAVALGLVAVLAQDKVAAVGTVVAATGKVAVVADSDSDSILLAIQKDLEVAVVDTAAAAEGMAVLGQAAAGTAAEAVGRIVLLLVAAVVSILADGPGVVAGEVRLVEVVDVLVVRNMSGRE